MIAKEWTKRDIESSYLLYIYTPKKVNNNNFLENKDRTFKQSRVVCKKKGTVDIFNAHGLSEEHTYKLIEFQMKQLGYIPCDDINE